MRIGDYVERTANRGVFGNPMSQSTKDSALTASRAFFRDLQEWEWIPRRFDSGRALETPRSIRAPLGPNPRVIADEVHDGTAASPDAGIASVMTVTNLLPLLGVASSRAGRSCPC
ncbi:hypothetical protein [Streptomyces sp. NBC_01716]|uniref:hypothetical protein n=1 Tax=Streptomyces sp. NBC_01716 TaxID=2975917 RepID=UPI002E3790B0|nr:hypothetical protein [Streptomyces sp. NBC_01716]